MDSRLRGNDGEGDILRYAASRMKGRGAVLKSPSCPSFSRRDDVFTRTSGGV
jgi:hypothetical protein